MLLRLFQRQVALQCRGVVTAAQQLNVAAQHGDQEMFWLAMQNLLTCAANVSKACWGPSERYATERQPLRRSLTITKKSPLRGVWLRNRFEHWDEALDEWWEKSPNHNHLDMLIGPPSTVKGFKRIEMFRVYDPERASVIFWGKSINFQKVVAEAERVLAIAQVEASKPHWDDSPKTSGRGQKQ